jgi:DNA-binding response OmpR family regulator
MSRRVLVVDDSSTVRRVVERTLIDAGFDVLLAADGREGLEVASARVPDLVLVDFVMPHMNGFQLCQALRAIDNLARVPVVLMSAKADRIGDGFLAQTGAVDAITKPFSPEALLAVATHALARAAELDTPQPIATDPEDDGGLASEAALPSAEARGDDAPSEARRHEESRLARRIASRIATVAAEAWSAERAIDPVALAARIMETSSPEALLSLAGELAEIVPALRGESALEGRIEHVALGEVLQMLQHLRQTGVLEVRRGERAISVCMSNGAIDLALGRSDDGGGDDGEFRLGRYLLEEELIDRDDLARLLASRASGPRTLLGTRLVKLGYLSKEDLQRALVRQTSELVYEALRWKQGTYRFVRFATRAEATQARLGLPIGSILMEGLRRVDEWRLIEEQIHAWDEVLRADLEALAAIDLDRLSREERTVLEAVDGTRTIREIVEHTRMGSFEVSKILFQLLTSRLLRR